MNNAHALFTRSGSSPDLIQSSNIFDMERSKSITHSTSKTVILSRRDGPSLDCLSVPASGRCPLLRNAGMQGRGGDERTSGRARVSSASVRAWCLPSMGLVKSGRLLGVDGREGRGRARNSFPAVSLVGEARRVQNGIGRARHWPRPRTSKLGKRGEKRRRETDKRAPLDRRDGALARRTKGSRFRPRIVIRGRLPRRHKCLSPDEIVLSWLHCGHLPSRCKVCAVCLIHSNCKAVGRGRGNDRTLRDNYAPYFGRQWGISRSLGRLAPQGQSRRELFSLRLAIGLII